MTATAIVLYGSRARGDASPSSDTDLIAVTVTGKPERLIETTGVSVHAYPEAWLLTEASTGSLFVLHVVREGIALFDPDEFLPKLRSAFKFKNSYEADLEAGARVVAAFTRMNPENFSASMRRRYFWGLRTAIMAHAAEHRAPAFSAEALEALVGVTGLALHIHSREHATFSQCCQYGPPAMDALGSRTKAILKSNIKENLERLFEFSGVAGATAGEIIYGF